MKCHVIIKGALVRSVMLKSVFEVTGFDIACKKNLTTRIDFC